MVYFTAMNHGWSLSICMDAHYKKYAMQISVSGCMACERKDAIKTKIESSSVQMNATHLRMQARVNKTQSTSFIANVADAGSESITSGHSSIPGRKTGNQLGGYICFLPIQYPEESIEESSLEFSRKLLKHVIELMEQMIRGQKPGGNPFARAVSVDEYLTSSSANGEQTIWYQQKTESIYYESEASTFDTKGSVKTSDGREIPFSLSLSMSREFMEETSLDTVFAEPVVQMMDPLIINLDVPTASVTDQKFFFDIDRDGKNEKISAPGKGSGFLALDKNGDGVINDGGELFGTESGNGFADLAAYDKDRNGWIDENDSVYSQLRVWTKDKDGKDQLMSLQEADVGAIFLGNVYTGFDLTNADTGDINGRIQNTGIFLHESTREAGTIQHVDLAT